MMSLGVSEKSEIFGLFLLSETGSSQMDSLMPQPEENPVRPRQKTSDCFLERYGL